MPTVTEFMPDRPVWFDVATTDPEGARSFYGKLFGWTFDVGGPEVGGYAMCQMDGRNAAGLGPIPPGQQMPSAWTVYFGAKSLEDSIAKATAAGGSVIAPPMDIFDAGRMAILADNTGAVFGLWQAGHHIGAQVADEPGGMAWCEVATRDADKSAAFYGSVFGLAAHAMPDSPTPYFTLHQGEPPVCGVMAMTPEYGDMPPHWMPYFAVADADAAAALVTTEGGKVHQGPFDTPYGRIVVISDPQGAHLSIMQPPAA